MSASERPTRSDPLGDRARAKVEAFAKVRATEARRAKKWITEFVGNAKASGLTPEVLKARSYGGDALYRTNISGWYIRKDKSIGIGTDGGFYILSTPTSLAARITGVTLKPSDPPMELGKGSRDGESIPLPLALERRLAAGDSYP